MIKLSEGQQEQVKKLRSEGLTIEEVAAKMKELYQVKVSTNTLRKIFFGVKIDGRGRGRKAKSQPGVNKGVDKEITTILQEITDLISDIKSRHLEELKKIREELLSA